METSQRMYVNIYMHRSFYPSLKSDRYGMETNHNNSLARCQTLLVKIRPIRYGNYSALIALTSTISPCR